MQKRPRSWSNHEHFVLDVQLLIYRAAYNFCVDLPLTLESVNDDKFAAANQLLDAIGAPQLTKEEVLAKAFPAFELSGDRLTWFAREKLPAMRGQAADVISLLTLPYENTYPSSWFSGELAKSRFLELEGGEEGEEGEEQSPRVLAIVLSQALISGVVSTGGEEIEGLEGLEEWELGDEEKAKPVLASAADISKCEESSRAIWIGEGEDAEELKLSVAAKLINDLTLQKLTAWVLTRLHSVCEKRKRGAVHFRTEEQEMRARLAADARARGAARRGRGGSSRVVQLQAELAQAKETALSMAKLLLAARETGQTVQCSQRAH